MNLKDLFIKFKHWLIKPFYMTNYSIGRTSVVLFELGIKDNKIIFNEFLSKLLNLNISLLWFNSYEEYESFIDLFDLIDDFNIFIFIG